MHLHRRKKTSRPWPPWAWVVFWVSVFATCIILAMVIGWFVGVV